VWDGVGSSMGECIVDFVLFFVRFAGARIGGRVFEVRNGCL